MTPLLGFFLTLASLFSPSIARADDSWGQVKTSGFGQGAATSEADRGALINDLTDGTTYIYFPTKNLTVGAGVFRSSDGLNWVQINSDGFDQGPLTTAAIWISSFNNGSNTAIFAGSAAPGGAKIYRSLGGKKLTQWEVVFSSVTTFNLTNNMALPGYPATFNGAFYIGTKNSATGAEIWKSTSADWIAPWIQVSSGGFNGDIGVNETVSYLKTFNGNLFAATNCPPAKAPCGQIWMSTGTVLNTQHDTWTQVLVASNTFDASKKTSSISALESYNGFFYATTLRPAGGAQMFRTADPTAGPWTQVFSSDGDGAARFSVAGSSEIHSLNVVNGSLYAGTWDPTGLPGAGLIIYRSTDGVTWTRSNAAAGFGSIANQYVGGFVGMGTFVYAATLNDSVGGAIWRSSGSLPGTPILAAAAQGVSSITWTWSLVANATAYDLVSSTGGDISGFLPAATVSFTQTFLSTNTAYTNSIVAVNSIARSTSAPVTRSTFAMPPIGSAFQGVFGSSFTAAWSANFNPLGTSYRVQYGPAGGSTQTVVVATNNAAITGLLGASTYFLNVLALNGDNVATTLDTTISTVTLPILVVSSTITASSGTVTLNVNLPGGPLVVTIPGGAFQSPVNVTLSIPGAFPGTNAAAAVLAGLGVGFQLDVNPAFQPTLPVSITLPYRAVDLAGNDPNKLVLARFDALRGTWVPLSTIPNPAGNSVRATSPHLSLFQLMAATPSTAVSAMKVFPNPLRPAMGHTLMTFSNLPSNSRLRVYTMVGELINDLSADPAGIASWDATNRSGAPVASGVYFVLVEGAGQKQTFKVAVER